MQHPCGTGDRPVLSALEGHRLEEQLLSLAYSLLCPAQRKKQRSSGAKTKSRLNGKKPTKPINARSA